MNAYRKYDDVIRKWSKSLPRWHGLVYCLTVCKRSASLYLEFVNREGWGDRDAIHTAHGLITQAIAGIPPDPGMLNDCLARIEHYTPNTEDFSDCVYAQDAGIIHFYSTELLRHWNASHIYYVARYCYEIADASVFEEVMPHGGVVTAQIERAVETHEYIVSELSWQTRIRKELSALPTGDPTAAAACMEPWAAAPLVRSRLSPTNSV